jgi:hypothetical protein
MASTRETNDNEGIRSAADKKQQSPLTFGTWIAYLELFQALSRLRKGIFPRPPRQECNFLAVTQIPSESGGIGRRTRLRIWPVGRRMGVQVPPFAGDWEQCHAGLQFNLAGVYRWELIGKWSRQALA